MIGGCVLASALEHGTHSNDKQYDCPRAQNLRHHDRFLSHPVVNPAGTKLDSILLQHDTLRSDLSHESHQSEDYKGIRTSNLPNYLEIYSISLLSALSRSYPAHRSTGKRGYLGNPASVAERSHK